MTLRVGNIDDDTGPQPSGLEAAGIYADTTATADHGLVVLAMGLPYWVMHEADGHRLLVEAEHVAAVREQLALFDRESVDWPPRPMDVGSRRVPAPFLTPLLWALGLMVVFRAQYAAPDELETWGALNAAAIFGDGEWWRAFTALFLHADVGHLVSNLLFGTFVFAAWISTVGVARGWLSLLGAAIGGNLAAAALRYGTPYVSIGGSTAVFAGIGLLTGNTVRTAWRSPRGNFRWRGILLPLAAGLTLLGLLGAGGFRTDVLAHATGFGVGLVVGFGVKTRRSPS